MKKILVHNLIILDASGSMSSMYDATLNGFNGFLKNIKATAAEFPEQEHRVSFVSFNTYGITYISENVKPDGVPTLSQVNYRPNGGTPLHDAIGTAANRLRVKTEYFPETKVLVSIFTDGYENASVAYSAKSIRELIVRLEQKGWTFTYLGTDHDVTAVTNDLDIKNTMSFHKSQHGLNVMFDEELKRRKRYYSDLNCGRQNRTGKYFEDGE
ncbi:VWA domain-containing protein [Kaistella pullorum]|uniref:VWA domain-containing protein n=1 Tax=Kaistella pullorum TaxID=2763074 RepID=A0ABR8WLW1_9FLAO|nr:vWA domain-containing protein [Kaistella pullorum]MBD8018070.1 VWA domain-containing protein [Kaistella pullorum]